MSDAIFKKLPIKNKQRLTKLGQAGFFRGLGLFLVIIFLVFAVFKLVAMHASADSPEIKSGISGYCIDDQSEKNTTKTTVDAWRCNGGSEESWTTDGSNIKHGDNECLAVQDDATSSGAKIVADSCSQAPGQVWLHDQTSYKNPNSGLCLALPSEETGQQLIIATCDLTDPGQSWTAVARGPNDQPVVAPSCATIQTEGEKVACFAEAQWTSWQSGSLSHDTLLNNYSDGNGYEEWCADFVNYIYKQAGYPFSNGERDGWDEYLADNIQNMGNFTLHQAGNYTPQPGDIAYFNYPGGHVEIVISGGPTPTFIYGDSGTVDPSSGNGDMAVNTITSDGNLGQVTYYLSPN